MRVVSTRRQCPGRSGAAAGWVYCSQAPWQMQASDGDLVRGRRPSAPAIGRSCAWIGNIAGLDGRPFGKAPYRPGGLPPRRNGPGFSRVFSIAAPKSRPQAWRRVRAEVILHVKMSYSYTQCS